MRVNRNKIKRFLRNWPKSNNLKDKIRVYALHSLTKSDQSQAKTILTTWLPELDESQQKLVTKVLSGSRNGAFTFKAVVRKRIVITQRF